MKKWSCHLEVVTPLFLSGANQDDAELRPPTLKNLMRWWYRSAKGGSGAVDSRSAESFLFGNTDQAGKFRPRIGFPEVQGATESFIKEHYEPGIQYFGFSLDFQNNKRVFYQPGTSFEFELLFQPGVGLAGEKSLLASLWLLLWLGGVGSRSRRGFGSLAVKESSPFDEHGLEFYYRGNVAGLPHFLERNLSLARSWVVPVDSVGSEIGLPEYSILTPRYCRLHLWRQPFPSWQAAMDQAGISMMGFRKANRQPDYAQVKSVLRGRRISTTPVNRAAFGLPIEFYFGSLFRESLADLIQRELSARGKSISAEEAQAIIDKKKKALIISAMMDKGFKREESNRLYERAQKRAKGSVAGQTHIRRASPLQIKVLKLNEGEYALLFLTMKSQILSQDGANKEKLKIQGMAGTPPKTGYVNQPTFQLLDKFLVEKVLPRSWPLAWEYSQ